MDIERSEPPLVQLHGACKSFFTEEVEARALDAIDLCINEGEYVALSGPSGCGKSTLLSLLGLLDVWDRGRYLLAGHDVATLDRRERAHLRNREIGFVFQAFNLVSDLTIAENVALPLGYRADVDKRARRGRVLEALDKVGMTHRAGHFPAQLSGGQQQRVAVARAVVGAPSLILADEPTGNLDSRNAEAVVELLEALHQGGATLCMVTHDPQTAARAQRQIALLDGRMVSVTAPTHADVAVPCRRPGANSLPSGERQVGSHEVADIPHPGEGRGPFSRSPDCHVPRHCASMTMDSGSRAARPAPSLSKGRNDGGAKNAPSPTRSGR